MVFILVSDPLFLEAIEAAAGGECLSLADEETLLAALQENTPSLILLDLGLATIEGAELVEKLKRNRSTQKIPIVVFGNSLRADLLQDAKEAGADLVLAKAAFREQLPGLMRHYDRSHK